MYEAEQVNTSMHWPIWAFDCHGVPAKHCACSSEPTCIAVHCLSALANNSSTPDTIEHNPSTCITIKPLPGAKCRNILPPGATLHGSFFFEQDARLAVMYICDQSCSMTCCIGLQQHKQAQAVRESVHLPSACIGIHTIRAATVTQERTWQKKYVSA